MSTRIRWSDNDRYFGPLTVARQDGYRPWGVMLGSGDGDDDNGCRLRLEGFGWTLILALPPVLKPDRHWVDLTGRTFYRADGTPDVPPTGYWDTRKREYGATYVEKAVHLRYGAQTHSSDTDKSRCWFPPWLQQRHVRQSLYGLNGEHVWTQRDVGWSSVEERRALSMQRHDEARIAEEACPSRTFAFEDYDGERLTARAYIEEREWRLGEGWFRWLSWFAKPLVIRRLSLEYSGEVGRRKGSWKGGTIATNGPIMLPGEMHEAAFRRHCADERLTFISEEATPPSRKGAKP